VFDLAEDGTAILNLRRMKFIASIAAIARLSIALAQSLVSAAGVADLGYNAASGRSTYSVAAA